jgi:glycosyltransferase involved in cell wall biosynthesis
MGDVPSPPLISIVIPTFNVEGVVATCLDSIGRQTFVDYDVVIMDGVSTDKTVAVVSGHPLRQAGRLSVHVDKDQGIYDAMKRGVGYAQGQWLLFLGADDFLYAEDTLAQVAAVLHQEPQCQLAYGDVVMRSKGERYGGVFDFDRLLFEKNMCHQAIFYRRDLFATVGPYNLRYPIWADWDFNIRCFANPLLVSRHMALVVANYNDTGGLSMKEDVELQKRLPVFLLNTIKRRWDHRLINLVRRLLGHDDR